MEFESDHLLNSIVTSQHAVVITPRFKYSPISSY